MNEQTSKPTQNAAPPGTICTNINSPNLQQLNYRHQLQNNGYSNTTSTSTTTTSPIIQTNNYLWPRAIECRRPHFLTLLEPVTRYCLLLPLAAAVVMMVAVVAAAGGGMVVLVVVLVVSRYFMVYGSQENVGWPHQAQRD